jgi:hypothetical protein
MTTTQTTQQTSVEGQGTSSSFDDYLRSLGSNSVPQSSLPKTAPPTPQEIGRRIAHEIIGQLRCANKLKSDH